MIEDNKIIPINFEEDVVDRLKIKLTNEETYKDVLDKIPHEFMADDLILTYWVNLSNKPDEYSMLLITNNLLTIWGIDDFTLKDNALGRAEKEEPYSLQKLNDFLEITDEDSMAYALTNKSKLNGASVIAYPLLLPYICKCDFHAEEIYLIPSSVHEFIVLPKEKVENIIDSKEVLSDHLYKYTLYDDTLESIFY